MSDDLRLKIGADASEFDQVVGAVQQGSKKVAENFSRIGGAVSSVGSQFAELGGQTGKALSTVGQFAGSFAAGGAVGLAVAAASIGAQALIGHMKAAEKASADALKSLQKDAEDAIAFWNRVHNLVNADKKTTKERALDEALGREGEAKKRVDEIETQLKAAAGAVRQFYADNKKEFLLEGLSDIGVVQHVFNEQNKKLIEQLGVAKTAWIAERDARRQAEGAVGAEKFSKGEDAYYKGLEASRQEWEKNRKAGMTSAKKEVDEYEKKYAEFYAVLDERSRKYYADKKQQEQEEHEYLAWRRGEEERYAKEEQEKNNERLKFERELAAERKKFAEERRRETERETQALAAQVGRYTQDAVSMSSNIASSYVSMWVQLSHARERGDIDTWQKLKAAERDYWLVVTGGIASYIGQKFAAEGALLVARGTAEAFLGNPGGAAAMAIGAGMVALGGGAMVAGAWANAEYGARQQDASYSGQSNQSGVSAGAGSPSHQSGASAGSLSPSSSVGYGTSARSSGGGPTVVYNTYNIGVAVGNYDEACRQVADMNSYGREIG